MYLHRNGAKVFRAPFSAASQMVQFRKENVAPGVVGGASCMVFGEDRVIIGFDWETGRFSLVELDDCAGKSMLNRQMFADLMLLSGCSIIPPMPELEDDSPQMRVQNARSILSRANYDGHAACLMAKDEHYLETFRKARAFIRYQINFSFDGKLEIGEASSAPTDVHEFAAQRLAPEVLYYMSRGLIGPRVLNWRVTQQILEVPPLDGGNTSAYKDLIQVKLLPIRAQTLALLTRFFVRYYVSKEVDLICWFSENEKKPVGVKDLVGDIGVAPDKWNVRQSGLPDVPGVSITEQPLLYAIEALVDDAVAKKTVSPREQSAKKLEEQGELLANTVWRFLQDRTYINPDHTLSAWGKVLRASLDRARSNGYLEACGNEAVESIFLATELLRLDVLNSKNMFNYTGTASRGSDTDKANTLLISRIACLGEFHHKEIGYTGPLSRHLLAYHQMAAIVRSSLRDLLEVHACNMFLSSAVNRKLPSTAITKLASAFPLEQEPDLGLSLLVKSYLDELSNTTTTTDISKWFVHASDIQADLDKAWKLWAAVNAGVQAADSSIVNNETRRVFKNTDDWLQQKLDGVPRTNGTA
nr:protein mkt1 [Quercus suber]